MSSSKGSLGREDGQAENVQERHGGCHGGTNHITAGSIFDAAVSSLFLGLLERSQELNCQEEGEASVIGNQWDRRYFIDSDVAVVIIPIGVRLPVEAIEGNQHENQDDPIRCQESHVQNEALVLGSWNLHPGYQMNSFD
eukprot:CAMPEP_0194586448 /NCGR_PEP_ID=MMETSP0292-20121207/18453_1 /TAXON_ID=39354 /ORGANISM="Heterosigma akashiwo, Strain CCMP2393" /LENGTH=138 /DNA_ID=CAMNT_0039442287 /DNA_START=431 /DNA_END=848 /DNA_ORIENTATION=+